MLHVVFSIGVGSYFKWMLFSICITIITGERDFRAVVDALCRGVATHWLEIGLLLGIPYSTLELIRDSHDEVAARVNEVVRVWLEERYNVEWFGRPSWKKLIEVMGARAGGNNGALAVEIAREHPAGGACLCGGFLNQCYYVTCCVHCYIQVQAETAGIP